MDGNQVCRLTPRFRDRAVRVLRERNASPFEANRFFKLPAVAQLCGLTWMEKTEIPTRELITDMEEIAEQRGDL